jgi:protein-S-isoprenylcysteine O-methyltransferase Ste14
MNLLSQPWHVVFLAGFVAYIWIRHVFSERVKGQQSTDKRIDGLEKGLLVAVGVASLLPLVFLFTPVLSFADYDLPVVLPAIGSAVMVGSLWLFWRSHADLGRNWSVSLEIRENHELVTNGVYRVIRHPMYAAIWLWNIGQGLLLFNWLAGWAVLFAFAAMYLLRMPREEAMMRAAFGEDYRVYAERTGRVLPKLG